MLRYLGLTCLTVGSRVQLCNDYFNLFTDISQEDFRQMQVDGTLAEYTCHPCSKTSDMVETALRGDYVHRYLENESSAAGLVESLPQAESICDSL